MNPADIGKLRPDDRFHVHGIRLIVDRHDWPRGLRWEMPVAAERSAS